VADAGPYGRALLHLGRGETGQSLECLERAMAEQSSLVAYIGADPLFDPLRTHRRFQRLVRSMGL
jgi:hypothetical protein